MKFTFPVTVKKHQADSMGDAMIIPQLSVNQTLTPDDQELIRQIGLQSFLIQEILSILKEKESNDEEIYQPDMIDKVLEAYMKANNTELREPHDLAFNIDVTFNATRKHCHIFRCSLPIISKTALFLEIAFATVSQIGSLELSEGVFPMTHDEHEVMSFVQGILSSLFVCCLVFTGPGQAFMEDFGKLIDNFFLNPFKKRKEHSLQNTSDNFSVGKRTLIRFIKSVLALFVLNFLWTSAVQDYQNALSISTRIAGQDDSLLPKKLVFICAWTQFSLNQFNDPLNILSTLLMGFRVIDTHFKNQHKPASRVVIEVLSESEEDAPVMNSERILSPSAAKGLMHFGALSPKKHPRNNSVGNKTDLSEIIIEDTSKGLGTPLLMGGSS